MDPQVSALTSVGGVRPIRVSVGRVPQPMGVRSSENGDGAIAPYRGSSGSPSVMNSTPLR